VLLTFAWDWARKGGSQFLEAVQLLRASDSAVVGMLVVTDERAAELEAQGAVGEAVRVLTAIDEVRELYAAADVFVAASSVEGMPFAVLEALASGTPVVASDIPSHRFIGDDLPALRLAERSGPALAAAIARETDERPTRGSRAAATRSQLEAQFSLSSWAHRLGDTYSELMPPATR
jgi:glycosyltransferase involved in cell wall biosynthesis